MIVKIAQSGSPVHRFHVGVNSSSKICPNAVLRGHVVLVICALLVFPQRPALGQRIQYVAGIPGATTGRVTAIALGIAGVSAGITFGVYAAVKHNHSVTGCATAGPGGLQLTSESDQHTYTLIGEIAGIKPGDRVRVSGKKEKNAATPQFLVEKIAKDFGPCEAASASP